MLKDLSKKQMNKALNDDELKMVSGGQDIRRSNQAGVVEAEGQVSKKISNVIIEVNVNGLTIQTHLSGQMRMYGNYVTEGQRVLVEYYPDDPSKPGRIIYSYK